MPHSDMTFELTFPALLGYNRGGKGRKRPAHPTLSSHLFQTTSSIIPESGGFRKQEKYVDNVLPSPKAYENYWRPTLRIHSIFHMFVLFYTSILFPTTAAAARVRTTHFILPTSQARTHQGQQQQSFPRDTAFLYGCCAPVHEHIISPLFHTQNSRRTRNLSKQ